MRQQRIFADLKNGVSALALMTFALGAASAFAGTLPGHGHFVRGTGAISRSDGGMTVDQTTQTGIVNWKSFSLGRSNSILFDNNGGATLNIVRGNNLSRISGSLQSNGSVYLVNRAGVVIRGSGRIDTQGAFGASGRGVEQDSFGAGRRPLFAGHGKGNVIDRGAISARNVSLIAGGRLRVNGEIAARNRVETSGDRVGVSGADISAQNWLIDPRNLKVASGAASAISASLNGGTNVTLRTRATSCGGPGACSNGPGDITIAAPIAWNGTARLFLDAYRSDIVDQLIHVKGKGTLAIRTNDGGTGGDLLFGKNGEINFDSLAATLTINGAHYTLENKISGLATDVAAHPAHDFALAKNLKMTNTFTSAPVSPTSSGAFHGTFEGLGHTISNLTIVDPSDPFVGLFGYVDSGGILRDIGLAHADIQASDSGVAAGALVGFSASDDLILAASVSGNVTCGNAANCGGLAGHAGDLSRSVSSANVSALGGYAGSLAGYAAGDISASHASGAVSGGNSSYAGGLAGAVGGNINGSYATGRVSSTGTGSFTGGLTGIANGYVLNSYAKGDVSGGTSGFAGGLVGAGSNVKNSHATGQVDALSSFVGGLAGSLSGNATGDYATGDARDPGTSGYVGGLIGAMNGNISSSHATGDAAGGNTAYAGGLAGSTIGDISDSYAAGNASTGSSGYVGGLVAAITGNISNSSATGNATVGGGGGAAFAGGLVGAISGDISKSHATGDVIGGDTTYLGGLAGSIAGSISQSFASGDVHAGNDAFVGGLAGNSSGGTINKSHATGEIFAANAIASGNSYVGGLVGLASGDVIKNSYATSPIDAGSSDSADTKWLYVGGLVGFLTGGTTITASHATGSVSAGIDVYAGGLFGYADTGSVIKHDFATGGLLTAGGDGNNYTRVGGLGGYNLGKVIQSYATGSVTDANSSTVFFTEIGGLIGFNQGSISQSFATGNVLAAKHADIGGLVGVDVGPIGNSYALGDVTCGGTVSCSVGGLVGWSQATIKSSYSAGFVTGSGVGDLGGLVGTDGGDTYTSDHWDATTSGISNLADGVGNIASAPGVTGKNNHQLKTQSLALLGFSSTVWSRSPGINGGLPYLKQNPPP